MDERDVSFAGIVQRCLECVDGDVDKREGSVVYDMIAPAAAELAQFYVDLNTVKDDCAFVDTMSGENLTKKAAERGVQRSGAVAAVRRGFFVNALGQAMNVAEGSRFSAGDEDFAVTGKLADGEFLLQCETAGSCGNRFYGMMVPIVHVPGLAGAELAGVIVAGMDEENDEELLKRYRQSLTCAAFGGNVQDYRETVCAMDGVGGAKVYPVWAGGGTVKVVIVSGECRAPSAELLEAVQTAVDPVENSGLGYGTAPVGHKVTVCGAEEKSVDVELEIVLQSGADWQDVKQEAEEVVDAYLAELAAGWADSDGLVVRASRMEARLLGLDGVLDILSTRLNGQAGNIQLLADEVPVRGEVEAR